MEHFAGLDVSLQVVSICVVDTDGAVVACGCAPADPEGIVGWFHHRAATLRDLMPRVGASLRIPVTQRPMVFSSSVGAIRPPARYAFVYENSK